MGENYQYVDQAEPAFVKVYLNNINYVTNLPRGHSALMGELLQYVNYASNGQAIILNKIMKEKIADKLGISVPYLNHAMTDLIKKEILIRIERCTYQINPYMFGKGSWDDIVNIRTNRAN